MGKNVAVFVDVANIFYAAKAAGVDIDYVLLLKAATAGRDLVRAYAYTGLDPDNENQRNFHAFLARNGFKVVSKDIRKYGDGKVKANLDIELVVDMMKTSRNLDVAVVVSGDGDFAPAIRAVQEMGVRVEVISFRGNTSSDLMEVADKFTDITQLAKVERGSTVSGRRVASDEEDLSMTEVPDKESEGTGRGRGRGRGRARTERVDEVAAESGRPRGRGRGRTAVAAEPVEEGVPVAGGAALVALPGEKLSKAAVARAEAVAAARPEAADEVEPEDEDLEAGVDGRGSRRRRRGAAPPPPPRWSRSWPRTWPGPRRGRGGSGGRRCRGRGRGRGRRRTRRISVSRPARRRVRRPSGRSGTRRSASPAPRGPRRRSRTRSTTTSRQFPSTCSRNAVDSTSAGRGPSRGRGSAVAAARTPRRSIASATAVAGASRLSRAGRAQWPGRRADAARGRRRRSVRAQAPPASGPRSDARSSPEPWSEVPPELEELLRAQLAQKLARQEPVPAPAGSAETPRSPEAPARRPRTRRAAPLTEAALPATAGAAPTDSAEAPARRPRGRRPAAADASGARRRDRFHRGQGRRPGPQAAHPPGAQGTRGSGAGGGRGSGPGGGQGRRSGPQAAHPDAGSGRAGVPKLRLVLPRRRPTPRPASRAPARRPPAAES